MEAIPAELRLSPVPVVALLRLQRLHAPLAAQLGEQGFRVLSIPDGEIDYPAERPERPPPTHYEHYRASGILKPAWVAKHTTEAPVRASARHRSLSVALPCACAELPLTP